MRVGMIQEILREKHSFFLTSLDTPTTGGVAAQLEPIVSHSPSRYPWRSSNNDVLLEFDKAII